MAKKKIAGKRTAKKNERILKRKAAAPQKKRGIPKTKKSLSSKKIISRLPSFSELKRETFELDVEPIAEPSHHFSQARIRRGAPSVSPTFGKLRMAPEEEILELPDLPKPEALRAIERKKRIPHAITAVLAGGVLGLFSAFVFLYALSAGELLTVSVSAAIFVGFTIFVYNKLEVA